MGGSSLEVFYGKDGFAQLLARTDIEACAVALPAEVQPGFIVEILTHKRHVFSQKPIATSSASAIEIQKQVKAIPNEVVWFVADPLRYEPIFHPTHLKLSEIGSVVTAELCAVVVAERCSFQKEKSPILWE